MSNNFGYLDLILLAMIAGFIILRLRNVLGRKTGHQSKVVSGFSEKKFEEFKKTIKPKKQPTEFNTDQKKQFLKGAEIAYETIINSFAKGDKKNLKDLVTEEMNKNFESAIEERNSKNIKSELTFIGIKSSTIEKFDYKRGFCTLTAEVKIPVDDLIMESPYIGGWTVTVPTENGTVTLN